MKKCKICSKLLPLSEFSKNKKNKDGLDTRCKSCRRKIYAQNREKVIAKVKENYQKKRDKILEQKKESYPKKRDTVLKSRRKSWKENPSIRENNQKYKKERKRICYKLLGNSCKICGHNDQDILVIDHIHDDGQEERKTGLSNIKLWNKIINEGDCGKYQLLCFNCNLKKSIQRGSGVLKVGVDKKCPTCAVVKDLSEFKQDRKYKDGYYYECKICTKKRNVIIKQLAFMKLGSSSCVACGTNDMDVLTVDHVNNDGWVSRNIDKTGVSLYRKLVNGTLDRNRFKVLCLNCNIKKFHRKDNLAIVHPSRTQNRTKEAIIDFSFGDVIVSEASEFDFKIGIEFLENYHYNGYGRHGRYLYIAKIENKIIAVFKFASVVRLEVASSLGLSPDVVLELDRICVHPSYHKRNFVSYLLSKIVNKIYKTRNYSALVTFADPEFGHDGTVYKASNWKLIGKTSRSYVYVDPNGKEIHKKTVYNAAKARNLKEREYAEMEGLRRSYTVPKIKFVYLLDKKYELVKQGKSYKVVVKSKLHEAQRRS
jgi:hypothetical protein